MPRRCRCCAPGRITARRPGATALKGLLPLAPKGSSSFPLSLLCSMSLGLFLPQAQPLLSRVVQAKGLSSDQPQGWSNMLSTGCGFDFDFLGRLGPQHQGSSRRACAAASPDQAAGLPSGEGRGGGAKNPKGRRRAAAPTQLRREAKLEPSGSGPKPVGTFAWRQREGETM